MLSKYPRKCFCLFSWIIRTTGSDRYIWLLRTPCFYVTSSSLQTCIIIFRYYHIFVCTLTIANFHNWKEEYVLLRTENYFRMFWYIGFIFWILYMKLSVSKNVIWIISHSNRCLCRKMIKHENEDKIYDYKHIYTRKFNRRQLLHITEKKFNVCYCVANVIWLVS